MEVTIPHVTRAQKPVFGLDGVGLVAGAHHSDRVKDSRYLHSGLSWTFAAAE